MKLDAIRRKAGRLAKDNSRQVVGNLESADIVGKDAGESGRQVQRYIRLTELLPDLLQMADDKKLPFNPAVELSYLTQTERIMLTSWGPTIPKPPCSLKKRNGMRNTKPKKKKCWTGGWRRRTLTGFWAFRRRNRRSRKKPSADRQKSPVPGIKAGTGLFFLCQAVILDCGRTCPHINFFFF